MPQRARSSATATASRRPALLALVADVSAALAGGAGLAAALPVILELVRTAVGATSCEVWSATEAGAERLATAGSVIDHRELPAPYGSAAEAAAHIEALPLASGARSLGLLALARHRPGTREERLALHAVANLLAAALASAEQARRFAAKASASMRELETQHRFIERIVDSLPVGLYVVDRAYRVHAWNRKRETGMQGILRQDALGRTIFEILRRQPADLLRREFDEVFRTGAVMQLEVESRATGELRTYRVSKIPMRVEDGAVTHVITIGEDITDWKRAQERIAQAEKLAALGQLSAGVMHEINNPLATIAACAETMALHLHEPDTRAAARLALEEYCQIIDQEVHRCKRIVDGLLDFSHPKAQERASVSLNDVVAHTLFLLGHHTRFKMMRVETRLDPALATTGLVHANRDQLVQVVMAILLNAADATERADGTVVIRTFVRNESEAIVAVEDEGHGIPSSELGKIFEPFYTTKPPGRGTGLGLSICYGIVANHGGRIEVESAVGTGSTFRICLPVTGTGGQA